MPSKVSVFLPKSEPQDSSYFDMEGPLRPIPCPLKTFPFIILGSGCSETWLHARHVPVAEGQIGPWGRSF
eukprot:1158452-Pelagomonas_calceolata.AAC.2